MTRPIKLLDVIVAAELAADERLVIYPDTVDRMAARLILAAATPEAWTPTVFHLEPERKR